MLPISLGSMSFFVGTTTPPPAHTGAAQSAKERRKADTMAKPTTRTSTTTAKAEAEIYLDRVEFEDHNNSNNVSEDGRAILAYIARMDLDRMLEAMGSNGEPFNALKSLAEKDLGFSHTASEYLGYAIQGIVESKLAD